MTSPVGPDIAHLVRYWHLRPDVVLVLGGLAALYVSGWRRLRARQPAILAPGWRLAAYLAGIAGIAIALLSPLDPLADVLFTAHMLQHQLLLMVAPPLLLLGNPYPFVVWGLPHGVRMRLGTTLSATSGLRAAWRTLTWMPVAATLYVLALFGWHYPALYEAALEHRLLHDLEHLSFFGSAVLFWWPIVNPAPRLRRLTTGLQYGYRIGYLVLATGLNTLLGAVLAMTERVLYPTYAAAPRLLEDWSALDDQAFGGGVMWSGSHMYLLAILVLVARFLRAEERRATAAAAESEKNEDARPSSVV
ncbi:MAG: cytochrome c oxidase assembly protein [Candidatus Rokuibacteriota bacterium]|nr:MAG: cytochrome c oxidase assembly protein [Candidatus Rokubacteria bacterium]